MKAEARARTSSRGDETRERIKRTARDLFARYGIERITIREIARAAGQKNGAAINYYFRTKEDLILEVLDEVASEMNEARGAMLDRLEAAATPLTIRDILKVLIDAEGAESKHRMRLLTMLQLHRRDLMHTAIPGRWDEAYRRCVAHLRPLLPPHPEAILQQRLYFLIPYLWTFLATREGWEGQAQFWRRFWADRSTIESLLDTAEAILVHPPSAETRAALGVDGGVETAPRRRQAARRPRLSRNA